MISLAPASPRFPLGLRELLTDVGGGENGFEGTTVHSGEITLEAYVQQCCDLTDPAKLPPGCVPQTMFWVLDANGIAVGMVKVRHYLNDKLRFHGGHIGFFIRRDQRGKGYGKEALRLALTELRKLGEPRALITVYPNNAPSIHIIEENGGRLESIVTDPGTGKDVKRYWVELASQRAPAADG